MLKLLRSLAFFVIPLFLLSYLIDLGLSKIVSEIHEYPGEYEVWNDIFDSNISAKVAIYGSSRAWVHINPEIITDSTKLEAYNFGVDGQNFMIQYLRHKKYFKHNEPPELIILSLDVFSLSKAKDLYGKNQFLPYMLWDRDIYKHTIDYNGFNKIDYLIPLVRYGGNFSLFESLLNKGKDRIRTNGYRGMDRVWSDDLRNAEERYVDFKIEIDTTLLDLIEVLIDELNDMDIPIVFVYSPELKEGQNFVKNRNEIISIYSDLAKKHDIPFLDYSDSHLSDEKTLFYNASHLNRTGSIIFTTLLVRDLLKFDYLFSK